ncbi:MAG: hypothetical protein ACKV19_04855 [Verrucomicrobiales bacterium]
MKSTAKKSTTLSLLALSLIAAWLPSCASTDASTPGGASVKPYPLNTCIVSDNELGSMGPVITKVYQNQEVKFCCKPCIKEFDAEPAKFLAKLPK